MAGDLADSNRAPSLPESRAAIPALAREVRRGRWARLFFFLAVLATGIAALPDYGVNIDEKVQRRIGVHTYRYVAYGDPGMLRFGDRDYGVVFELPAVALEVALGLDDTRSVALLRHGLVFAVFVAGLWWFWQLSERIFGSWRHAALACTLLVLSPRIFGDAFHNSKDLVLLAAFTGSMLSLVRWLDAPNFRRAAIHALACALVVDIRVVGLMAPALTAAALGARIAIGGASEVRRLAQPVVLYVVLGVGFTVLFWPYLWTDPLGHFTTSVANMAQFRFRSDLLYLGRSISNADLPWHYVPVWIAITTPLYTQVAALIGAASWTGSVLRSLRPFRFSQDHLLSSLVVLWAVGPIAAVAILGSVLYESWRHLYFVYPAIILLAIQGLTLAARATMDLAPQRRRWVAAVGMLGLGVALGHTATKMIRAHPHQNVTFNAIGHWLERDGVARFPRDFWGLATRQGLEAVLAMDAGESIHVTGRYPSIDGNLRILPPAQRARLVHEKDPARADYYVKGDRAAPVDPETGRPIHGTEVHRIEVSGRVILQVLKRGSATGQPGAHDEAGTR